MEDVDLGWLEVEAGIDLNHRAGPGGGGVAGVEQQARQPCCDLGKRRGAGWEWDLQNHHWSVSWGLGDGRAERGSRCQRFE